MNFLNKIIGAGVKETLGGVGQLAKDLRSAITGEISADKKAEIESKIVELEEAAMQAQNNINLEEAKHKSIFVAGWRPFIGWVCGVGIAYQFLFHPALVWALLFLDIDVEPPMIDRDGLMALVVPLLGLGAYRTAEKMKGVNNAH